MYLKYCQIDCSIKCYIPSVLLEALLYEDNADTELKGP
jgi:hypothetical protein